MEERDVTNDISISIYNYRNKKIHKNNQWLLKRKKCLASFFIIIIIIIS